MAIYVPLQLPLWIISYQRQQIENKQKLLTLFKIADVNSIVLTLSINSEFVDFEDAVQYYSGEYCEVEGLVTRNTKDYKNTDLPIYTPDELWGIVNINQHGKV